MDEKFSQLLTWHPSYKQNANLKTVHVDYNGNYSNVYLNIPFANTLPKEFPYMVKPFDYAVPNEYNRWNDFTIESLDFVNPFFPFPPPLYLQFGYTIRIVGKIDTFSIYDQSSYSDLGTFGKSISFYSSNPCSYNNWDTFVNDMYHKVGCSIMHNCKYSREAVIKIFQNKPLPTATYLDTIKTDIYNYKSINIYHHMSVWEYMDDTYKITVEIFPYKEKDQYGNPLWRFQM